ncbi:MAG: hypothetical protein E7C78_01545 [Dermabacter sp.]|nr:hypothetical protein [Dermabacter sp.]
MMQTGPRKSLKEIKVPALADGKNKAEVFEAIHAFGRTNFSNSVYARGEGAWAGDRRDRVREMLESSGQRTLWSFLCARIVGTSVYPSVVKLDRRAVMPTGDGLPPLENV